jgi:hypothetical protein
MASSNALKHGGGSQGIIDLMFCGRTVAILVSLIGGSVSPAFALERLQEALEQAPGTVENAGGVTTLDATWRAGISLNSKTGASTIASGESVSWLVGRLSVDQRPIVFASAVWRANGGVDTLDATRPAIKTFVERGVLESRH